MHAFFLAWILINGLNCVQAGRNRLDELFTAWNAAQQDFKSLVVEFTSVTKDPVFNQTEKSEGTFRMLRTETGAVFASYEAASAQAKNKERERSRALLNNGIIYLLDYEKKTALRFEPSDDARGFLERHFGPLVTLLDRKRAEEKWSMKVEQDEWYTYLTLKLKKPTTGV